MEISTVGYQWGYCLCLCMCGTVYSGVGLALFHYQNCVEEKIWRKKNKKKGGKRIFYESNRVESYFGLQNLCCIETGWIVWWIREKKYIKPNPYLELFHSKRGFCSLLFSSNHSLAYQNPSVSWCLSESSWNSLHLSLILSEYPIIPVSMFFSFPMCLTVSVKVYHIIIPTSTLFNKNSSF